MTKMKSEDTFSRESYEESSSYNDQTVEWVDRTLKSFHLTIIIIKFLLLSALSPHFTLLVPFLTFTSSLLLKTKRRVKRSVKSAEFGGNKWNYWRFLV